jgi:ABC-type amino acid transport substrate-binding protein
MKPQKYLILIALLALIAASCAQPTPAPTLRPPEPARPTDAIASQPTRSAPAPAPQDDSWQKVQQSGVLRVGTSADYPPFEYYNDKFQLDGYDIALIQQIGQRWAQS